jgi:hypothetical protein
MEEKVKEWEILAQNSQGGCKFLGQGGDVKQEEFHCSYDYCWNETPKPPFI